MKKIMMLKCISNGNNDDSFRVNDLYELTTQNNWRHAGEYSLFFRSDNGKFEHGCGISFLDTDPDPASLGVGSTFEWQGKLFEITSTMELDGCVSTVEMGGVNAGGCYKIGLGTYDAKFV